MVLSIRAEVINNQLEAAGITLEPAPTQAEMASVSIGKPTSVPEGEQELASVPVDEEQESALAPIGAEQEPAPVLTVQGHEAALLSVAV
jgi:hypothetical protein